MSVNVAYFEWKYDQNPYIDTPLIYVALHEGKVVGMRGFYGTKWETGHLGQILPVPCAGDSVTAPEHRERGLYTKITSVALNDLDKLGYTYVFSLSAGPIVFSRSLAMGWRSIGSLQTMVKKAEQKTIPLSEERSPFSYFDRNVTEYRLKTSPYIYIEKTAWVDAMAELLNQIGSDGRIRHVRDQQYFAWRFRNPLSMYRFLYWEDSSLDGYLILQAPVYRDRSRVCIVDWEAINTEVRVGLLQAAINLGRFYDITIWSATLPDKTKIILQNTGFTCLEEAESIKRHSHSILLRPVHDGIPEADWVLNSRQLLDLANWDMRIVYSDVD